MVKIYLGLYKSSSVRQLSLSPENLAKKDFINASDTYHTSEIDKKVILTLSFRKYVYKVRIK